MKWILILTLGCLAAVAAGLGGPARSQNREAIIGGPCDGCDAVFAGMPEKIPARTQIAPPDADGPRLLIEGTVFNVDGDPQPGVVVYAYHTDIGGLYPRDKKAGGVAARHGTLRGWAKSDDEGNYAFETIRPGSYPNSTIPAHVHMHVIEPGCCTYYIDDIVFADDPFLSEQRQRQMLNGRGGSGLTVPSGNVKKGWTVRRDIHLGKEIADYPADPSRATPEGR